MNKLDEIKFNKNYQQLLQALKLQGKTIKTIDAYSRAVRRVVQHFESPFKNLIGNAYHVKQACHELGQQWAHGIRQCEKYFPSN